MGTWHCCISGGRPEGCLLPFKRIDGLAGPAGGNGANGAPVSHLVSLAHHEILHCHSHIPWSCCNNDVISVDRCFN